MKIGLSILLTLAVAVPVTWIAARKASSRAPVEAASAGSTERRPRFYQSAMHPWIKSDQPGRCTICGMELTPVYEGDSGVEASGGGDVLALNATMMRVLSLETAEASVRPLKKSLRVAGMIDDNNRRHRVLSAYLPGRVQTLAVNFVGAEVTAGQPLAEFYSPTLLQAEREYRLLAGMIDDNNRRHRVLSAYLPGRVQTLAVNFVGAEVTAGQPLAEFYSPTLLQAEREYRLLAGEMRAATALRLLQMGLTAAQIEALPEKPHDVLTSSILAPMSGTVVSQNVFEGQYVQEGDRLFEIADFSIMWFLFQVYEQDLPWLQEGLAVDVTTPSRPGEVVTGRISFVDPSFDETTRSTKVRVELENPVEGGRRRWLHRIYAEGRVHLTAPTVLTVPRSAVLDTGVKTVAYVDQGGGAFARRVLRLGRRGDELVEVLSGLSAGDRVVTQGNLLLDGQSELNRTFEPLETKAKGAGETSAEPGPLTEVERLAVQALIAQTDRLARVLAADDLRAFNEETRKTGAVVAGLRAAFAQTNAWWPWVQPVVEVRTGENASDLKTARQSFYPLSQAVVPWVMALRERETAFASVKVFRCPMTKDAFPGAPARAEWLQVLPEVRNPYFGAEMLDCGAEVKSR